MTHTYQLTGMTCGSCEAKVKSALLSVNNVTAVEVSKDNNTATITMEKHIALSRPTKRIRRQISNFCHTAQRSYGTNQVLVYYLQTRFAHLCVYLFSYCPCGTRCRKHRHFKMDAALYGRVLFDFFVF